MHKGVYSKIKYTSEKEGGMAQGKEDRNQQRKANNVL
jgi:hypothetical protein